MVKVLILITVLLSTIALITLYASIEESQRRYEAMRQEAGKLEEKIGELGAVQSVKDIAQEELGLVDPNTVIINPNS